MSSQHVAEEMLALCDMEDETIEIETEELYIEVELPTDLAKPPVFHKGHWEKGHYISAGSTGRWSKWGGARMDLIQQDLEETWYCQSCRQEQPKDLTPLRYEYPEHEYIRVCAICFADGCKVLHQRIARED